MCYWTFAFFYFHCVLFNIVFQVLVKGCLTSQGHGRAQPWTMLTSCQRIEFCFKTNFDLPHVFSISVVFFCLCCVLLVFYCFLFYFSQLFFIVLSNFCSVFIQLSLWGFYFKILFCSTSVLFFLFICNFCCFYFCCVFSIFHCYVEPWWFLKKLNVQNERDHTEKNCNLKMLATRIEDISSWVITAVTLNQILQSKWQKETRKVIKPWV